MRLTVVAGVAYHVHVICLLADFSSQEVKGQEAVLLQAPRLPERHLQFKFVGMTPLYCQPNVILSQTVMFSLS